tara:strand:- start:211 stop:417 length:207 start_codon:yes stop_codon:yes gene_type:complete
MIPIIMAGILGIYGLIIAILLASPAAEVNLSSGTGFKLFSAGLCCGLSALASGLAIGAAGEAGVKAYA